MFFVYLKAFLPRAASQSERPFHAQKSLYALNKYKNNYFQNEIVHNLQDDQEQ
jgi:hypothetical protein